MKVFIIILAMTWLSCGFVIASAFEYPSVTFTTHLGSAGSYEAFVKALRNNLQSGSKSHDIAILRKPSKITNQNMFLLVKLTNYDEKRSVRIAVSVVDAYVVAFTSGVKSFFLKDAPIRKGTLLSAQTLLFNGTHKQERLSVSTNYGNLGDRETGLGINPLGKAIVTLNMFVGRSVDTTFGASLLIIIQMVSVAARFKFIELKIVGHILDEYNPKNDTITYENKWDKLSKRIQLSRTDGKFKTQIDLKNADGSAKPVTNAAQVKSDMTILKYNDGSRKEFALQNLGKKFVLRKSGVLGS